MTDLLTRLEAAKEGIRNNVIHNVTDRRNDYIGSWETEPLDAGKLTAADIGRTVIYRDFGRAEAGTLTSWRDDIVFARYSKGDTSAGANASDLVFGIRTISPAFVKAKEAKDE